MTRSSFLALEAWRRRGNVVLRDPLWAAAAWEARGDDDALTRAGDIVSAAIFCDWAACDHAGGGCWWTHDARLKGVSEPRPAKLVPMNEKAYRHWCAGLAGVSAESLNVKATARGPSFALPGEWGSRPQRSAWA